MLTIEKYLRFVLSSSVVDDIVDGRVHHIVCPESELNKYPYIVFQRDSLTKNSTKDGEAEARVECSLMLVAKTADELTDLTIALDEAFKGAQRVWNEDGEDFIVDDQDATFGSEHYDKDWCEYSTVVKYSLETQKK